jgi:hypothetical protein
MMYLMWFKAKRPACGISDTRLSAHAAALYVVRPHIDDDPLFILPLQLGLV